MFPATIKAESQKKIRVIAATRPFSSKRIEADVEPGGSIEDILRACGCGHVLNDIAFNAHVWLEDTRIRREWWGRVYPHPDTKLTVRVIAMGGAVGGGGGEGGKDTTRTILTIAVLAAAIAASVAVTVLSGGALGPVVTPLLASLAGAAVTFGGYMAINALAPPQAPRLGARQQGERESATYNLTGSRNSANPYGPVPRIFGRHRVFPPLAANPYTEIRGDDQYLRMIFTFGYGPLDLTDLKIGETPIENFSSIETEIIRGDEVDQDVESFPAAVFEDSLSILLRQVDGFQTRTTQESTDEISVDFTFPQGVVEFNSNGAKIQRSVQLYLEYAVAGSGTWIPWGFLNVFDSRAQAIRKNMRRNVTHGQYDVRVRRTTLDSSSSQVFDTAYWTTLRSIEKVDPVNLTGLCKVALVIKATDQINGIVDTFNAIAQAELPVWDGDEWTVEATRNPAWAFAEILRGAGNKRPVDDERIDLDAILEWAEANDEAERYFDAVIDFRSTVFEMLRNVAGAGRASVSMNDGRYGVVRDKIQTTIIQHFTPRNSSGFRGVKVFRTNPHALKVRFINADANWQQDERIVYDDGYTEENAEVFEVLELIGITSADQAWKEGRYHIAAARLRPEIYELNVDVEHLVCTRGDLVRVTHDVRLAGVGQGRILSVQTDIDDNATGITTDEAVLYEEGRNYDVRIRLNEGATVVRTLTNQVGYQTVHVFTEVIIPSAEIPNPGDLCLFGDSGQESVELIVKSIEPGPDLTAKLILVDHSPAIYDAETGDIPPYDPNITVPPILVRPRPNPPQITAVQSDESVLFRSSDGSLESRILVSLNPPASGGVISRDLQGQYRPTATNNEGTWFPLPYQTADSTQFSVAPVEDGDRYDVRLRYVTADNITSDWTLISDHLVIGKTTPPPDPGPLTIEGTIIRWTYPNPPPDFEGFRVRHRSGTLAIWTNSIAAHDGFVTETTFDLIGLPPGQRAIMVKAFDTAGNESVNASILIVDLAGPGLNNILVQVDHRALGWPDLKENCTVSSGDLVADPDEDEFFWPGGATLDLWPPTEEEFLWPEMPEGDLWPDSDDVIFWADDADLFWEATYKEMKYTAYFDATGDDTPSRLTVAIEAVGNYTLDYRFTGGELDWLPWPGALDMPEDPDQIELRVTIEGGRLQGILEQMVITLDAEDIEEDVADVEIDSAGTRLVLTKEFHVIRTVILTLQEDGGDAVQSRVIDKDVDLGPLVKVYDSTDSETDGTVDARVRGY